MERKEYTIGHLHRHLTRLGMNLDALDKLISNAKSKARINGTGTAYIGGATTPNLTLQCDLVKGIFHWYI